jgi:hypothetical protein
MLHRDVRNGADKLHLDRSKSTNFTSKIAFLTPCAHGRRRHPEFLKERHKRRALIFTDMRRRVLLEA